MQELLPLAYALFVELAVGNLGHVDLKRSAAHVVDEPRQFRGRKLVGNDPDDLVVVIDLVEVDLHAGILPDCLDDPGVPDGVARWTETVVGDFQNLLARLLLDDLVEHRRVVVRNLHGAEILHDLLVFAQLDDVVEPLGEHLGRGRVGDVLEQTEELRKDVRLRLGDVGLAVGDGYVVGLAAELDLAAVQIAGLVLEVVRQGGQAQILDLVHVKIDVAHGDPLEMCNCVNEELLFCTIFLNGKEAGVQMRVERRVAVLRGCAIPARSAGSLGRLADPLVHSDHEREERVHDRRERSL